MKLRTGTKLELKLKTAVIQDSAEMILGEKYLDLKQCTRAALGRMAGDQDLVYLGEPWITTQLLRSHSCPAPLFPPAPILLSDAVPGVGNAAPKNPRTEASWGTQILPWGSQRALFP